MPRHWMLPLIAVAALLLPMSVQSVHAEDEVTVEIIDWEQTMQKVAAHKGKVVIVDVWSLSCLPCRREFPNLVQLHKQRSDEIACISVSVDYDGIKTRPPEYYRPKVLDFLKKQDATFQNVLCSVESDVLFDRLKLGSIPAVFVFDQQGRLAHRFADPQDGMEYTYQEDIIPFVEGLLQAN
ncbi:Thiol:disulfide interchange protein TlpA [Maioricimonas rarisocia]|uniref:Thiol:disulfide interchange protein TlpA n=1 Tax=Maioricimonas rarisocia TaxID=2528026 RepID=A0A517Z9P1_9PLAN|nr:TlpA disulfide reductase family protein [Maioricimonas rarisocia]QDU39169.1 Thiol:disulfide interchange protein TlpA [Maioricimonas rarisocia]